MSENAAILKMVLTEMHEELDEDFIGDLQYKNRNNILTELEDTESLPDGWKVSVKEKSTELDYDSYGNAVTDDAFLILNVTTAAGEDMDFKLPGSYDSYEYWQWDISNITEVVRREKVVTYWEWTNA